MISASSDQHVQVTGIYLHYPPVQVIDYSNMNLNDLLQAFESFPREVFCSCDLYNRDKQVLTCERIMSFAPLGYATILLLKIVCVKTPGASKPLT